MERWRHALAGLALAALAAAPGCGSEETGSGRAQDARAPDVGAPTDASRSDVADRIADVASDDAPAAADGRADATTRLDADRADAAAPDDGGPADAGDGDVGAADGVAPGADAFAADAGDDPTRFSFAVLADPHLDGTPARERFLSQAVERLIAEQGARRIELVFVLGDIAWGGDDGRANMRAAREILDRLEDAGIRWVPVLGDNEVQAGGDEAFHEVFGAQYERLAGAVEGWWKLPTPVDGAYLQSFSFEHRGCHFVSPDFISRERGDEAARLHEETGGSWDWFRADIEAAADGPAERINILTHHGLFQTGFASADRYLLSDEAMAQVVALLCPYREHVAASYGGHIHQDWFWTVRCDTGEPIYEVWITDDAHDALQAPEAHDERVTIRVVAVVATEGGFAYEQHVLTEPIADE